MILSTVCWRCSTFLSFTVRNIVIVRNPDLAVESDCTVVDQSFNLEAVQMEAAACECSFTGFINSFKQCSSFGGRGWFLIILNHSFKSKSPCYLRRIKHSYKAQYISFF